MNHCTKNIALALLVLICISKAAVSDSTYNFPLSSYVPTDYFRHYLMVSPMLRSQYYGMNKVFNSYDQSKYNNQNGDLQLSIHHEYKKYNHYFEFSGTSDLLGRESSYFSSNEYGLEMPSYEGKINSFHASDFNYEFKTNNAGRWYYRENTFLSYLLKLEFNQRPWDKNRSDTRRIYPLPPYSQDSLVLNLENSMDNSDTHRISVDGTFPVGFGRINDVSFPARIYFILERIQQRTNKKIILDIPAMNRLQSLVETRRKERMFVDTRAADIYDIETLAQSLSEKSGLDHLPAGAILEMADEWSYSQRQNRKSGWDIKAFPYFRFEFDGSWRNTKSTSHFDTLTMAQIDTRAKILALDSKTIGNESGNEYWNSSYLGTRRFGLGMAFAYEKPIHRFYQFSASASARLEKFNGASRERNRSTFYDSELPANSAFKSSKKLQYEFPAAESEGNFNLSWYPSTRTTFGLSGTADYRVQFDYTGSKKEMTDSIGRIPYQDVRRLNITGQFYGNYFLSPRLGLLSGINFNKSIWHTKDGLMDGIQGESIYQASVESGRFSNYGFNCSIQYYLF